MAAKLIHTAPDIYEVVIPFTNISTNATNSYIVVDSGEALVIDTGAPTAEAEAVLREAVAELGLEPASTAYFLTHFHLDHAGLVDRVVTRDSRLYVGKKEYARTRADRSAVYAQATYERFLQAGASMDEAGMGRKVQREGSGYVSDSHTFVFVEEGDTVQVGRYRFEVIDTAGHTAGHLSLFDPGSGILFSGDHLLFVISPSIDYFPEGQDGFRAYLSNLEKVGSLPVKTVLHSHGPIREDHGERIAWLIDHHVSRLDEAESIASQDRGLRAIDLIRKISWNVPADEWGQISLVQRSVIIVQGLVILNHLVLDGRLLASEDDRGYLRYHPARILQAGWRPSKSGSSSECV